MELEKKFDICFLTGLPILRRSDWSREHYAPKSRIPPFLAQQPYNIRPALKIINSIKGNLLPCEWIEQRAALCYRALQHYNLNSQQRAQVLKSMEIFINAAPVNPCAACICARAPEYCPHKLTLDRQH